MSTRKSNFSVTCSLLSQFLKQKRSLGDVGHLDLSPRPQEPIKELFEPPTTMSLLPGIDVSAETQTDAASDRNTAKSMELFPQQTGFSPEDKKTDTKESDESQLTIFYGGQVLVFDNFPAEKANDLTQLAAKGSKAASTSSSTTSALADRLPVTCPSTLGSEPTPVEPNPCDLPVPIARRASLHRFLERRKDRINSKDPYQVNCSSSAIEEDSA